MLFNITPLLRKVKTPMNKNIFHGLDDHTKHMIVSQIVVSMMNKIGPVLIDEYEKAYYDVWNRFFQGSKSNMSQEAKAPFHSQEYEKFGL